MDKGAHFYKCDFQVHSPRDINWTGTKFGYNTDQIDGLTEEEIEELSNNRRQFAKEYLDKVQAPDKLTTSRRFNLTRSCRSKLITTSRSKLTT